MKKNTAIPLILGVFISALALYLAFKNVPFSELFTYLKSINYLWIFPSILTLLLAYILRGYRWQIILKSVQNVSFQNAFHPLMIGFMINCILPGRVGEMARPAILQKKEGVPFSTGLATVAAERVFDLLILLVLFATLFATVEIDPNFDIAFGGYHLSRGTLMIAGRNIFKLLVVLIIGIIMVSFGKTRRSINAIVMRMPTLLFFAGASFKDKIQNKFCIPLVKFIDNFASGFALVKNPARIYLCIGISVFIWGLLALSYYLMALGCPGIELSFLEITATMIIICFFIALPSVPGFWGIWEAGGVFALTLFGISSKNAMGYTLVNHACQVFPVIIVGFFSAIVTSVDIWQVSYKNRE